jgi:hypothetical protein
MISYIVVQSVFRKRLHNKCSGTVRHRHGMNLTRPHSAMAVDTDFLRKRQPWQSRKKSNFRWHGKKLQSQGAQILKNESYPDTLRYRGLIRLIPFTALKACER